MNAPQMPFSAAALCRAQALDGALATPLPETFTGLGRDSRSSRAGELYFAMGARAERVAHIAQARAVGVAAIVAEAQDDAGTTLLSSNARWSYARASVAAYGLDHDCPPLLGVTGTKGKSTTVHCAWWMLGAGAARVGTIGWHDGVSERANAQTTPPPEELHQFLAGLPANCPGVALEVSSHGSDQQRLAGLGLRAFAYTGLGRDHLDYHRSHAAYLAAKLRALRWLEPGALCVVNGDDAHAAAVAHAARVAGGCVAVLTFSRTHGLPAHLSARLEHTPDGWWLMLDGHAHALPVRLPGAFNAWNAAAAALMVMGCGVALPTALERLRTLPPIPGRLELLASHPLTYVDYAHTPESLSAVVGAMRQAHVGKRVALVFGCGGDRDAGKRAPMGAAAAAADVVVITTDNSRSETPEAIAAAIIDGIPRSTVFESIADRGAAIRRARALIGRDGVVVVAGKGHETTQNIQGRTLPWDDRAWVRALDQEDA